MTTSRVEELKELMKKRTNEREEKRGRRVRIWVTCEGGEDRRR